MTLRAATLSSRWPRVLLGDAVEFLDHLRRPITANERTPGPYPYYGANGQQDSIADYLFDEPLILLAEDGGYFDDPSRGVAYGVTGKCWVNNHAHVLRPRPDFDFAFLRWHLAHYDVSEFVNGTTRAKLTKSAAERIPLIKPPLSEQHRIADILDKVDAIRRKRREAIALTEELLRSAFLEMFGDPMTNPKRWPRKPFGELASIRRGASPRPIERYMGGSVPWIKIGDATGTSDIYLRSTAEFVTEEGAHKSVRLKPGALIVANSGVSLGFARILMIEGCIHDGWLAFEDIHERLRKIYLAGLINLLTPYFRRLAPEGTQPNLNTNLMRSFEVPLPPPDLQDGYEGIVSKLSHVTSELRRAASQAEGLFSALAQRAFSTNTGTLAC